MDKISVELGDVQKTLFLPLWGRAFEFEKGKTFASRSDGA